MIITYTTSIDKIKTLESRLNSVKIKDVIIEQTWEGDSRDYIYTVEFTSGIQMQHCVS